MSENEPRDTPADDTTDLGETPTEATMNEPQTQQLPRHDDAAQDRGEPTESRREPTEAHVPAAAGRPGVRVGTVVWGLVLAAIGAGILAFALGVVFDVQLAFIIVVAAAGLLLLVGSIATTVRRKR